MDENLLSTKTINQRQIQNAIAIVEKKIKELRDLTPNVKYQHDKLAEVEINKFFYNLKTIDRVMIVLRANGCEHYKQDGGCSMCSHFNGTDRSAKITTDEYKKQWENVIKGTFVEGNTEFNLNNYPVVCVYNLGTGVGYSVLDIVKNFEEATGVKIPYQIKERRAGDVAACYSDATKAKEELGWVAERGIKEMCEDSWRWQSNNPNGYND